jgi:hypothetical protein
MHEIADELKWIVNGWRREGGRGGEKMNKRRNDIQMSG